MFYKNKKYEEATMEPAPHFICNRFANAKEQKKAMQNNQIVLIFATEKSTFVYNIRNWK